MVPSVLSSLLALSAAPLEIPTSGITSAYTKLDLERCQSVNTDGEPQSATWHCNGLAGIRLIVQNGDDRYDIDAGLEDLDDFWAESFDYPSGTVEWRLFRGKPFAIIYRLISSGDGAPKSSHLLVETIGRDSPGCRVASINGSLKNANERARKMADRIVTGGATCMRATK